MTVLTLAPTPPPAAGPPRRPRVLGLDLSLTATGIAYPDGTTATVKTRQQDGDRRLLHIADVIRHAASNGPAGVGLPPSLAVVEDLPVHARSAGLTGMVHGIARTVLLQAGVPYALIPPATLKAYATGKGSGDKTPMAMAAYKRASREFDDDNQCDAWWLRAAGLDHLGHPQFPLPAAQRARLAKVNWPEVTA